MRTLGIDLAARPERTAACVVDWADHPGGEVHVGLPRTGCTDAALLALMREVDATAIDAPFGWPEFITRHLGEHATAGRWPLGAPMPRIRRRGRAGFAIARPTAPCAGCCCTLSRPPL